MTVIQPGSIAMLAFVSGDYFSQIFPLGPYAYFFYAALSIVILTAMNLMGTRKSKGTQNVLTLFKVIGSFSVIMVGMMASPASSLSVPIEPNHQASFGLAMVFVLLTFGGWSVCGFSGIAGRGATSVADLG